MLKISKMLNLEIALLDITTADYISRSALKVNHRNNTVFCHTEASDSVEKTYEYFSGDENDDNIWRRPWSPSSDNISSKRLHSGFFVRRLRKTWTSFARHLVQSWFTSTQGEYQLVNLSQPTVNNSVQQPLRISKRDDEGVFQLSEDPDIDFGTRTIRPPMPLYDGSEAPDYTDDMGLNLHILDDLDIPEYQPIRTTSSKDKARRVLGLDT
jgi:hypothetical protein